VSLTPLRVTPLATRAAGGLAGALRARGWDTGTARTAAAGIASAAFRIEGLDTSVLEALVHFGGRLGLEVLTGPDWAVIAGSRSRISALARPWTVPEELRDVALQVGLALPAEPPPHWRTARGPLALAEPVVVGILNVTPDSFSDGAIHATPAQVVHHAAALLADGAGMLDIGGESTRPRRTGLVPAQEELARVVPAVEAVVCAFPDALISVDTMKAEVASAALAAGAAAVNDVTGLRFDPRMAEVAARAGAGLVIMHSRGTPLEIASDANADYGGDIVGAVIRELREGMDRAAAGGMDAECLVVDPGLGFSKTAEQNMFVADQLEVFQCLGRPLLVGPSRKRFLGVATGREVGERDVATAAACALAWERGARLFRVHDARATRDALAVARSFGESRPDS